MQQFLRYVRSVISENSLIANCCVLVPSKRAALFLERLFDYPKPSILSLDEFIEQCYSTQGTIIEPFETLLQFYDATEHQQSYNEFIQWAYTALNDFEDIDNALVDVKDLFAYLSDVKAIELWNPQSPTLTDTQRNYLSFFQSQYGNYLALNSHLLGQKLAYKGMAMRYIANHALELVNYEYLYVVGFNAFNPAETKLFETLQKAKRLEFIWDADAYYFDNPNHEAGYFLRKNKSVFYSDAQTHFHRVEEMLDTKRNHLHLVGTAKQVSQAIWLGNKLETFSPEMLDNTAIVLANEGMLPVILSTLPSNIVNINVSMPYSLRNGQIMLFVNVYLTLLANGRIQGNSKPRYHFKDWLLLLSQPLSANYFVKKYDTHLQAIIDFINRYNAPYLSFEQLEKLCAAKDIKTEGLNVLFADGADGVDCESVLHVLNEILTSYITLIEGSETLLQCELEASLEFMTTLSEALKRNGRIGGFTIKSLRSLIEQSSKSLTLSYKGEPLKGLQILGLLESRCLCFEHVFVIGCNEGFLPKTNHGNTFLPLDVRLQFALPMPNEKEKHTAYNFYRLLHHTKNAYLVYDTDIESFGGGEPSRYLMQLKQELKQATCTQTIAMVDALPVNVPDDILIHRNEELNLSLIQFLTIKGLTPTSINTYLSCRLKFYLKYILCLSEMDEVEEFLGADVLGKLTHKMMELFYTPFIGKQVNKRDVQNMLQHLDEVYQRACTLIGIDNSNQEGKNILLLNMAKHFVSNYLQIELKRYSEKNSHTHLISLEQKLSTSLPVKINGVDLKVNLSGFADRIDLEAGITRIIDFKTGNVNPVKLKMENPVSVMDDREYDKALQLLHYAYIYRQLFPNTEKLQSGIVSLRLYKKGFMPLQVGNNSFIDITTLADYKQFLSDLIVDMFDIQNSFAKTNDLEQCSICPYAILCKRD